LTLTRAWKQSRDETSASFPSVFEITTSRKKCQIAKEGKHLCDRKRNCGISRRERSRVKKASGLNLARKTDFVVSQHRNRLGEFRKSARGFRTSIGATIRASSRQNTASGRESNRRARVLKRGQVSGVIQRPARKPVLFFLSLSLSLSLSRSLLLARSSLRLLYNQKDTLHNFCFDSSFASRSFIATNRSAGFAIFFGTFSNSGFPDNADRY